MNNPSDDTRRLLTEYIGECWHTLTAFLDNDMVECSCGKILRCPDEGTFHVEEENSHGSTFTTVPDLHAVYSRMVEVGKWEEFREYANDVCPFVVESNIYAWLFCLSDHSQIGERMEMAGEWLGRREK